MGCCIAIAMVIAAVRGAWFRLFPHRRPPESGFAPQAFRPAPGAVSVSSRPSPSVPGAAVPWTATLLGAAAIAVAGYAAVVETLALTGVLHSGAPLGRHLLFAAAGLAALVGAATLPGRPVAPARGRGLVLAAVGGTWTAASLADMHLFAAIASHHSIPALLLHAVGFAALAFGLGQLLRSADPQLSALRTAPRPLAAAENPRTP
ncbi:MAG: hypothetical protein ACT4QF_05190 [Sporichthyaceae bacterium]